MTLTMPLEETTVVLDENEHASPVCQAGHAFDYMVFGMKIPGGSMPCSIIAVATRSACTGTDLVCQDLVDDFKASDPDTVCGGCGRLMQTCWKLSPL